MVLASQNLTANGDNAGVSYAFKKAAELPPFGAE